MKPLLDIHSRKYIRRMVREINRILNRPDGPSVWAFNSPHNILVETVSAGFTRDEDGRILAKDWKDRWYAIEPNLFFIRNGEQICASRKP